MHNPVPKGKLKIHFGLGSAVAMRRVLLETQCGQGVVLGELCHDAAVLGGDVVLAMYEDFFLTSIPLFSLASNSIRKNIFLIWDSIELLLISS